MPMGALQIPTQQTRRTAARPAGWLASPQLAVLTGTGSSPLVVITHRPEQPWMPGRGSFWVMWRLATGVLSARWSSFYGGDATSTCRGDGGWETPADGETNWEENWCKKKSLSTQLQYVSRWYEAKVAGNGPSSCGQDARSEHNHDDAAVANADRDEADTGFDADTATSRVAANIPSEHISLARLQSQARSQPESQSSRWSPPPASSAPRQVDSLQKAFAGLGVQGHTVGTVQSPGRHESTRLANQLSGPRLLLQPLQPIRTSTPAAGPSSDHDGQESDMALMVQQMDKLAHVYQSMEPEFLATLEATKAASMAHRDLDDKRKLLGAARCETSGNKAAMEACGMDAKLSKRALRGAADAPWDRWRLEHGRDESRGAWQEARDAWLAALEREHAAYNAVTQALHTVEHAEAAEESALQEWNRVREARTAGDSLR
ncbi:hypothetical protein ColLi_09120 [Colletotrichum liriopes]|uniref:Uncharacterized protein n=1 Tax=Colletotrichum liriopes TaxID=708192 RepID=A0AA37GTL8_9PEZI|nr:hypothetical protein ColLi_09120 [Colletotrichum liriopes]